MPGIDLLAQKGWLGSPMPSSALVYDSDGDKFSSSPCDAWRLGV